MATTGVNSKNASDYSDFNQPTDFAKFELLVEGKSLFINAHTLADASPVFAKMFFGEDFKENKEQKAIIAKEKHANILELLQCLLPSYPKNPYPKPIAATNFVTLVRLSDKFNVTALTAAAEQFVDKSGASLTETDVLATLDAAIRYRLSAQSTSQLIKRAATVDETLLATIDMRHWPGETVKELMCAALEHVKKTGPSPRKIPKKNPTMQYPEPSPYSWGW